ncbi:hypothetical protein GT037_005489 [Alternaria burnsii]|uniref:Xylanolytic transcriptional activator regulatory domain-containing protein n=1 Tax=Alternaria burnsii TaxID=1187904 RepID=A0A8H7B411_9PLEO|nr:uncharacterized protein GT037_005489 [Alternaria burnsii]KAF7675984.1 hypothetical protein GT037_005489 [Alternaria burnsii]
MQSRRGIYTRKPRRKPQGPTAGGCTDVSGSTGLAVSASTAAASSSPTVVHDAGTGAGTASTAEFAERSPPEDEGVSSTPSTGCASSYREISWAATFDHLLERYHNNGDVLNKHSITYIGEAFPLGIVLENLREGGAHRHQLHHPGPPCGDQDAVAAAAAAATATESPKLTHPPGMRPEELAFLEAKQAFTAPPDETVDALIGVFFERVFPLYPIVNPSELVLQHKTRRIPWILLHALCFMSATYCPLAMIHRAGFSTRTRARSAFYDKAKALFDMSYEGNKIIAVQVCIMMSFWGGGPSHYWNFYTWICTGVTIAETIGFHRSMAGANIASQDRSLIKRLWWILVIRDAMCASIVGRPFRIHLEQCDVDALTRDDFVYDDDADSSLLLVECMRSPLAQQSGAYQIHAAKLALLLRHIIAVRFNPKRKQDAGTPAVASLQEMMTAWRRELPGEFTWEDHISTHSNVFVSTLRILYNHNVILAYVHSSIGSATVPEHGISVPEASPFSQQATATATTAVLQEDMLSDAAQQIASVSCNVVMTDDGQLPPHELFHGLFVASVVFYMMQTNGTTTGQKALVARAGVSGLMNCKMALHAARDTWDASPWITQLFDKVLCLGLPAAASAADSRAAGGGGGGSEERGDGDGENDGVGAMEGGGGDGTMGFNDLSASFDLDGFGMMAGYYGATWPNHPFLGQFV